MNYLYHMVPPDLQGKELMPLNELKKKNPKLYKAQVKKYSGRESVLKKKIPYLDCIWNDVIHMTAIHPSKVEKALKDSGIPLMRKRWFKINPRLLDLKKTIVYLYPGDEKKKSFKKNYIPLEISDLNKYNEYPKETLQYFKNNKNPLLFHLVPHILYKGNLKLKDLEIIELK